MASSTPMTKQAASALRTAAWIGLSIAQILPVYFVHMLIIDVAKIWHEGAVTRYFADNPYAPDPDYLHFWLKAAQFLSPIVLFLFVITFFFYIDHYFKVGEKKKLLTRRILTVAGVELAIVLAAVLLRVAISL